MARRNRHREEEIEEVEDQETEVEETEEEEVEQPKKKKGRGESTVFTYIGAGAGSPRVINFMGRQKFIRGEATEVTDKELAAKLIGVPTFVQGEATQEQLHEIDQEGEAHEAAQQAKDEKVSRAFHKKHKTE